MRSTGTRRTWTRRGVLLTDTNTLKNNRHAAGIVCLEIISWILLVFLDQLTKVWAVNALKGKDPRVLIQGVLEFYYLENHGAAFSLFQNAQWFFFLVAVAAITVIAYFIWKIPKTRRFMPLHILLTLIGAGAAGNLLDRLIFSYVRDFIYFSLINFPVFNVADMYVTVSTILLVILIIFVYRDEDFEAMRHRGAR